VSYKSGVPLLLINICDSLHDIKIARLNSDRKYGIGGGVGSESNPLCVFHVCVRLSGSPHDHS
jgi:hypothetical protein